MVSRTNQCALMPQRSVASAARTCDASPDVFNTHVPMSSSLVRRSRIASSSSRAIASGHHEAPAARMGRGLRRQATSAQTRSGWRIRARRSMRTSTCSYLYPVSSMVRDQRCECDPGRVARAVARGGERGGPLLHRLRELLRLRVTVDEPPLLGALRAHAFGQRAEDVGVVAPDAALVGEAREPAGAGQHAEQRHLGKARLLPTGRRRGGSRRRRAPARSRRLRSSRCTRRRT